MKIDVRHCRYTLMVTWFAGACVIALILIAQQVRGYYGDDADVAWSWFTPNVVPTLSLMVAVLVAAQQETGPARQVDRAFYRLTLAVSAFYLALLLGTVLVQPFAARQPLEVMKDSLWYLAPFQGLSTGLIGAFFLKKSEPGEPDPAGG